ncbi:phytanoyl-CoA dioxygenase family protein [Rhodospirillaceae bacterium]|nr:phytanoyl-CoA dioxygenase family protein [Rhodospirillaceae bacterium]
MFLELFAEIIGDPALAHPMFVQRNIFPKHETFDFTTHAHQDRVHIGGSTNYAIWTPIGDCLIDKGPLAIASGSHKNGVVDTRVGTGAGGMEIAVKIPRTSVTETFKAGDVLIFSDTTVHKAPPNKNMRFVKPSMLGISQRVPQQPNQI